MAEANLLVTFDPVRQESSKTEIQEVMKEAGQDIKIESAEEGLAELKVSDAKAAVKALSAVDKEKFNYTFYWWPVDEWCKAEVEDMQKVIGKLQEGISENEKWKLDLAKRKTTKEYGRDIIIKLTDVVDKKNVDLKNPEKIIKIEIIGDRAAISLLAKDELFSAH